MNGVDHHLLKGFAMYIHIIIRNIVIFPVHFAYLFATTVPRKGAEILSEYKPTLSAQATLMLQTNSILIRTQINRLQNPE